MFEYYITPETSSKEQTVRAVRQLIMDIGPLFPIDSAVISGGAPLTENEYYEIALPCLYSVIRIEINLRWFSPSEPEPTTIQIIKTPSKVQNLKPNEIFIFIEKEKEEHRPWTGPSLPPWLWFRVERNAPNPKFFGKFLLKEDAIDYARYLRNKQ